MRYVSTRGEAPELGFEDVLLTGLARDQMIAKLYTGTYSQDVIELDKSAIAGRLWLRAFGAPGNAAS